MPRKKAKMSMQTTSKKWTPITKSNNEQDLCHSEATGANEKKQK